MGKSGAFLEHARVGVDKRPIAERVADWRELEILPPEATLREQGARCIDCGIPFCNTGCPLGNLIPDWNDRVYLGDWRGAWEALSATNNFPEITGRICPAPCEAACVVSINGEAVTIENIERAVADRAASEGWLEAPRLASASSGKSVAVIGSGPAGLAAAQQLARAGHVVTVYERDDRVGGLLTYGIPDFKLDKSLVRRRGAQLAAEGVTFEVGVEVGRDVALEALRAQFDALLVATGARIPRDLAIPGRELGGIHFALDFLRQQNRRVAGQTVGSEAISAAGRRVVVIGGGDTGSDCIGTARRQGAKSVVNLEIVPEPPASRDASTPWPHWPLMLRSSSSHEEGCERAFAVSTERFIGSADAGRPGDVGRLACVSVRPGADGRGFERVEGSEHELEADLVLLALGFGHAKEPGWLGELGVAFDPRGNVVVDAQTMRTRVKGVFAAGDRQRGQSLVVWAIADGRRAARGIDAYLLGESDLPTPGRAGTLR